MKHNYLLTGFLVLFAVFSCAKDSSMEKGGDAPDRPQKITSNTISMDSLRSLALSLPASFSQTSQTRSTSKVIKEVVLMSNFLNIPTTRSVDGEDPLANIYVVNYANDQGFAILSADKRLVDVMAYSDNGNITDTLDNPGIKLFMLNMYDYANYTLNYLPTTQGQTSVKGSLTAKSSNTGEGEPYHPPLDDEYYYYEVRQEEQGQWTGAVKGPLLTVRWGQHLPYNNYVWYTCGSYKNAPAGCVATAMTQIMSYHSWPTNITYSPTPTTTIPVTLDWNALRGNVASFTDNSKHSIAALFSRIGDLVQMNYACDESTTGIGNARTGFNQMGYNTDREISYSYTQIKTDLNNNKPIMVFGRTPSDSGHAWVVDGYKSQTVETLQLAYWYRYEGGDTPHELWLVDTLSRETSERYLVHCNWGWEGKNNGWFYGKWGDFTTNRPWEYDEGVTYPYKHTFSIDMKMIKNIRKK